MTFRARHRRAGPWSWIVGLVVLGGVAWALASLIESEPPGGVAASVPAAPSIDVVAPRQETGAESGTESEPLPAFARTLSGVVLTPAGGDCAGARVEVLRALTDGPEWRAERLGLAITDENGEFRFDLRQRHGLLLRYSHPDHAGGFLEVPHCRDDFELRLSPGFALAGVVTSEANIPIAGVRVAVEAPLGRQRRVRVDVTDALGRYFFENLPAGQARLVARHRRWQTVATAVRVGETRQHDFRLSAGAFAPLRGRVLTPRQVPIAGARIDLLPSNGRLGLVDPISTVSDSQGRFELPGTSRGTMLLLVRHDEYGAVRRSLSMGTGSAEAVIELPPRSRFEGRLLCGAPDGPSLGGVVLRAVDAGGEVHLTTSEPDGSFAFERSLSPGRARIELPDRRLAFTRTQSWTTSIYVEEQALTEADFVVGEPTVARGRCVDEAGRPLAGVAIYGSAQLTPAKLIGSDLAAYMGSFGSEIAFSLGGDRTELLAISDADGRFEFTAQEPGPVVLHCRLRGRAERQRRVTVPPAGEVGRIEDVVMMRGCRIEGTVRRGGRLLAGVEVSVAGAETQTEVTTRADGRFAVGDLMPGRYRVKARQASQSLGRAQREVEVTSADGVPQIALELPRGRVFRGRVVSRSGEPVADALVAVRGAGTPPILTGADGSFSIELPQRRIQLQISRPDAAQVVTHTVTPGMQDARIAFDVPPTCTIVARVAGLPGKRRVPSVLLRFSHGQERRDRLRWVELQNGELRWPSCPVGRCEIEIRCEGYVPFRVARQLTAGAVHDLGEILLERGVRAQGVVLDAEGRPVSDAVVFVGDEADLDAFEPRVRSGADGSFSVYGVGMTARTLVAHAPGFAPAMRELRLPDDVLGEQPIELRLLPGATISVRVSDPPEAGVVQLLREGGVLTGVVLDDTGRAEFFDRRPGRYEVLLLGSDRHGVGVEIERPGQTVEVVLQ